MKEIICPIDGRPCDPSCKSRYADLPEGGCFLSDFVSGVDSALGIINDNDEK